MPMQTILLVISLVLAVLATVGVTVERFSLLAAAFAFFIAALLFGGKLTL